MGPRKETFFDAKGTDSLSLRLRFLSVSSGTVVAMVGSDEGVTVVDSLSASLLSLELGSVGNLERMTNLKEGCCFWGNMVLERETKADGGFTH